MYKPNPHATAAAGYDNSVKNTSLSSRELEARALLKSARAIQELQSRWDQVEHKELDEVLTTNRKLWMLFFDTAMENPEGNRPNDLRSNIVNLANFIFKRTLDILASPDKAKLEILVTINREIAAGLSMKQEGDKTEGRGTAQAPSEFASFSA